MSVLKKVALFGLVAALTNVAVVAALPQLVNRYVMHRIVARALEQNPGATVLERGGYNVALPAPRADAASRWVVRPSPDMLYTVCVFDLSERPLRITAPVQDSYVSVAGFGADTSNFFAVNDGQVPAAPDGSKHFDLVVALAPAPDLPAAPLVIAPSARGLILFRSLIPNDVDLPRLLQFQSQQRCDPL